MIQYSYCCRNSYSQYITTCTGELLVASYGRSELVEGIRTCCSGSESVMKNPCKRWERVTSFRKVIT